ncbi:MAG TPA: hypothetical protein VFS10_16290 [Pyrinomonadaceae bacterium]|nr:hypothetical protein [Pyrinomonadaceae bacterium]
MKNQVSLNPHGNLIAVIVVLVFVGASGVPLPPSDARDSFGEKNGGARQGGEKVLTKSSYRDEPIQILKVKNKKRDLPVGGKFSDDDADWLRGLTITVRNDSGKDITHLSFAILFPANKNQASSELSYTFDFMWGLSPQSKHYKESRRLRPERVIKQNDQFDLTLSDEQYEHIRKVLLSLGYPSVREIEIWIDEVGFDDGTSWKGGRIIHPGDRSDKNRLPSGGTVANSFFFSRPPSGR